MIHYTVISIINIGSLLVLVSIILKSDLTVRRVKNLFSLAILATIIVILAEITTTHFESTLTFHRLPLIIGNILGFSISPLIPILIGYAIIYDKKNRDLLFWVPPAINFILSLSSIRYPLIFGISNENIYFRGSFFWIYIITYISGIIFLFIRTLALVSRYQNKNRSVIFALLIYLVFGTSIQIIAPQLHVSWLCISFAICLYYTYCCELYSQVDGLTGLLGYRAYEKYISKIDSLPKATILLFDIDDFKNINDNYGHQFGDYCLAAVSFCIRDIFIKIGVCFRIGGDEFCVISAGANKAKTQEAYNRFLSEIESLRKTEKRFPTVSIGHSYYDKEKGTINEAIFAADKEMYHFKQQRKEMGKIQH